MQIVFVWSGYAPALNAIIVTTSLAGDAGADDVGGLSEHGLDCEMHYTYSFSARSLRTSKGIDAIIIKP